MIVSLKPKSPLRFIFSSPSLPLLTPPLKWVSTKPSHFHFQQPENPLHHLLSLLSVQRPPKDLNSEFALVSALKFCSTHSAISQGRQLHCFVLKSGSVFNIFIQNSLMNMYSKCGYLFDAYNLVVTSPMLDSASYNIMIIGYVKSLKLDDARRLFEKMPEKDCVSYTTMIMGFSQNDNFSEAIDVFKGMRNAGLCPNELTMTSVISAYSRLGRIWECKMLHGLVIKMLPDKHVLALTSLLHMYCVCSSLSEARALFDEMSERNTFSWNVLLNGYSKAGHIDLARDWFDRIPDKNVVSWCTIIDGYVQAGRLREAFMMYRSMVFNGEVPNEVLMVDLVSACGRAMAIGEGKQLHNVIVKMGFDCYDLLQATLVHLYATSGIIEEACLQFEVGSKSNVASWNALITGFIKNRMIDRARQLFDEMPKRDVFSWSSMISGYSQYEHPDKALKLFHEMENSGIQPNEVTMLSVFSAIAALGQLNEGKRAHEYVCNNFISFSDNLSAAIIDMYAKCGSINAALEVFYKIHDKASTVSPWNAIICGLASHGHAHLSLKIFSELQRLCIKLHAITFIGVLSACCHAGLVDLGKEYFKDMKRVHDIDPDIKHYGCMIDLLGRAGRLQEADEMINSMPMKADTVIWGTLLAACRTYGNVEIGQKAAENLARLEPSHGGSRVLLSNLYADAGRWEDAFIVRRSMQTHRMPRSPGCSGVL